LSVTYTCNKHNKGRNSNRNTEAPGFGNNEHQIPSR
jgi:hypothetical protein